MAHLKIAPEYNVMDGSSTTDNSTPERDHLLYHLGHAYRFLLLGDARASCYHLLKFGSREICRAFFDAIAQDLAMRHRLWLEALYWAAYFGEGVGHDYFGWLTEQVFTGRLDLYQVICTGPHRGEPQKPDEKQVRAAISSGMDNLPVVGSGKSLLQAVTGVDLITDEPVSRLGAVVGIALGLVPKGKAAVSTISEWLGEEGLAQHEKSTGRPTAAGFVKRRKGPDSMTRGSDSTLTEGEAKGRKDGNTRVATDKSGNKQGSAPKNEAYAKKMLRQKKKVGKASNRIGGPYTAAEMALWQEVKDKRGRKNHISAHTNTETGQVRVFERDHDGEIVEQIEVFPLNDFAAKKKKFIEDLGE